MPLPVTTTREFVTGLPKAELHLHLEGTLEPAHRRTLARRNGVDLGQDTTHRFDSLTSFLAAYYPAMEVLRQPQDFHDLANAYLVRAAADGVRRTEMFFDPQAHTSRGVPFADVIAGYRRAVEEAEELRIEADLIMCFLRDHTVESAFETLEAAMPFRDWILGVGLDSDERGNPPERFAEVFARARDLGYRRTMHCDVDQVGSIDNIRTVLHDIGVERIDHGSNVVEDPGLVDELRVRGIGLTCCPLSNRLVTAANDMKAAEIAHLLRSGVRVTVNSDDPAYFGGYVADNYLALAEEASLTPAEVVTLAENSFTISWLDDERRSGYLEEIARYVDGFAG
ncbi:MAG: adenosine deaminase [Acidimicrobiia bacterium]